MYRGKKSFPFFLLENSRPLSPRGPLDFLSTCLGIDSLTTKRYRLTPVRTTISIKTGGGKHWQEHEEAGSFMCCGF